MFRSFLSLCSFFLILMFLFLNCEKEAIDNLNNPPVIIKLVVVPLEIVPEGQSALTVFATDPEGHEITFRWSTTGGFLSALTGASVRWTAPDTLGDYLVTVIADDGQATDTAGALIQVKEIFGQLKVTSSPDSAEIIIDGQNTGQKTPHTFDQILIGEHVVRVEKEGFLADPDSLIVNIVENQTREINFTLDDQAPAPPQGEYFIIDFTVFPDTVSPAPFQKVYDLAEGKQTLTYENWGWAALNVAFWNAAVTLTLIVPVAAFNATIQEEPELQPDGRWLWTKNFNVGGILHTAELYGKTVTAGVEWEMYISKDGAYADFKWYTGFSNLPLTEGNWTLYRDPNDPVQFLLIEWHRNPQQGSSDIKYTNIVPGHQENGGYIYFEKSNASPFDRFYDIYNKGMDNLTEIEWNSVSREGRVLDPDHFNDSDWHCWDTSLMDTACP